MLRRVHLHPLRLGATSLDAASVHHLRDVLRLSVGACVEVFDNSGAVADAVLETCDASGVVVRVQTISQAALESRCKICIASAVPKGDRADWMVEKLSEIGCTRFIPLATARSVVLPAGQGKHARWERIALESAKQSRRQGVMQIDKLTPLKSALADSTPDAATISPAEDDRLTPDVRWCLSTAAHAQSVPRLIDSLSALRSITLFVGPEGGWADEELLAFDAEGVTQASLVSHILRVETAAVVAAGTVAAMIRLMPTPGRDLT